MPTHELTLKQLWKMISRIDTVEKAVIAKKWIRAQTHLTQKEYDRLMEVAELNRIVLIHNRAIEMKAMYENIRMEGF